MNEISQSTSQQARQADTQARFDALDINRSFCVSAPAGSGKTELLTQRILKLLATVEEPERVVAITFTRKAAAEMRERLVHALDDAAALEEGTLSEDAISAHRALTLELAKAVLIRSADKNWRLSHNPGRLRIQTFDSLCNAIVQSEPIGSRVGGALSPTDNADALYEQAVNQFFLELQDAELEREKQQLPLVDLLNYFYNRQGFVKSLLLDMLRARDQWLPYVNHLVADQSAADGGGLRKEFEIILNKLIEHGLRRVKLAVDAEAATLLELAVHARTQLRKNDYADIGKDSVLRSLELLQSGDDLPGTDVEQLMVWQAIAELLFTKDSAIKPRSRLTKAVGFPAKSALKGDELARNEALKALLPEVAQSLASEVSTREAFENLRELPPVINQADQAKEDILTSIAFCLQRLSAHLQLQFYQNGACDHAEIQSAALHALGANLQQQSGAIEYRWHRSIEHLLVDEFQDTSLAQYRLIAALTQHWPQSETAGDLGSVVDGDDGKRRSLFVVGDGMQSIYAFRNANVGLFLKAGESGIGGQQLASLRLTRNFRSAPPLIHWFNHHFSETFPQINDSSVGAVRYEPSVAGQSESSDLTVDSNQHAAVQCSAVIEDLAIENDAERKADARVREAEHIVELIQSTQRQQPGQSIAILLRGRSHGADLLRALDDHGIAWDGVDLSKLAAREVVMDLLTIYRAVNNLADDVAWWAMLRAPWCGLLLKDLKVLRNFLDSTDAFLGVSDFLLTAEVAQLAVVDGLSASARSRLEFLSAALKNYWCKRGKAPQRHLIYTLWKRLGGEAIASVCLLQSAPAAGSGAQLVSDLPTAEAMLDLIEDYELERLSNPGSFGLITLQQRVDRLYAAASPSAVPSSHASSANPPVQIMTMHKAKGLEFDTVILPALGRESGRNDQPILRSREVVVDGGEGVLLAPKPETMLYADAYKRVAQSSQKENDQRAASVYSYLKYLEGKAGALEAERLFYVAATRARRQLLLTTCSKADEKNWPPASLAELDVPRRGTMLANGWEQILHAPKNLLSSRLLLPSETLAAVENKSAVDSEEQYMAIRRWDDDAIASLTESLHSDLKVESASNDTEEPLVLADGLDDANDNNEWQRLSGIVYHEMMMRLAAVSDSAKAPWKQAGQTEREFIVHLHKQLSLQERLFIDEQFFERSVDRVVEAVAATLTGRHGQWLMDASHQQRQSEVNRAIVEAGRVSEARIDLSFVDEAGTLWIIDFKLLDDRESYDESSILSTYRDQLLHYRAIMRSELGGGEGDCPPIKCALYLPIPDKLLILNEI